MMVLASQQRIASQLKRVLKQTCGLKTISCVRPNFPLVVVCHTSRSSQRFALSSCKCSTNKSNIYNRGTFRLHVCLSSTSPDDNNKGVKQTLLLGAVYGSFLIGGFLLLAIATRFVKTKIREWKGVYQIDVPGWRKMKLFKHKGVTLPEFVVSELENIENFETHPDDVWIVSFPRSGTTWLQEIVYLIHSDMNFTKAMTELLDDRFPYLEFMYPGIKKVEEMPAPRLIKSHLPLNLLPKSVHEKKPKIIYIARNPRDVVVSYYYFTKLFFPITRYDGSFEEFLDLFLTDKVMYGPWSSHVKDFWDNRHEDNILYLTYEELKKDTAGTIDKIADFLGKRVSEAEKKEIISHCSFGMMKVNKMVNHSWFESLGVTTKDSGEFLRKGCIGDWSNHFDEKMGKKMSQMMARHFYQSDINFTYSGSHILKNDPNQ